MAVQQSTKRNKQVAARATAGRREAQRRDDVLQKQLLDQYGYGRHMSCPEVDDPEAIEMGPVSRTMNEQPSDGFGFQKREG